MNTVLSDDAIDDNMNVVDGKGNMDFSDKPQNKEPVETSRMSSGDKCNKTYFYVTNDGTN
jgi:hypothetical protein